MFEIKGFRLLFGDDVQIVLDPSDDGTVTGVVFLFSEQDADLAFFKAFDNVIAAVRLSGNLAVEEIVIVVLERL